MPITPIHLSTHYLLYRILIKHRLINDPKQSILLFLMLPNLIDLDHLDRLRKGESPLKSEYGLNYLPLHGWWNLFPIFLLLFSHRWRWLGIGWLLHLVVDALMVKLQLTAMLFPRKQNP